MAKLRLAGATWGYQFHHSLEATLHALAEHGLEAIDLTTTAPHLEPWGFGAYQRLELRRQLDGLGIEVVSLNPGNMDINVVSLNSQVRELTLQQFRQHVQLAHDLHVPAVVVIPGRLHKLMPMPVDYAMSVLTAQLSELVPYAQQRGVTIVVENPVEGLLTSSSELVTYVREFGSDNLRLAWDVANAFPNEDPVQGLATVADQLAILHVSDCWKHEWAHAQVGLGEIDFGAVADAAVRLGFSGPTVYELADSRDPLPRLAEDLERLDEFGWAVGKGATA